MMTSFLILRLRPICFFLLIFAAGASRAEANLLEHWLKPAGKDLHGAAARGLTDEARELIRGGADLNATDKRGRTPLVVAVECRQHEVAESLLKAGADVEKQTSGGVSALYAAATLNDSRMVELLLANGAKVNALCGGGQTALFPAVAEGDTTTVLALLNHGADVNHASEPKQVDGTALAIAVVENRAEIARLLLERGADPNLAGALDITPLYLASVMQHDELAALLKASGADPSIPDAFGVTPAEAAKLMKRHRNKKLEGLGANVERLDTRAVVYLVFWGRSTNGNRFKAFRQAFAVGRGQYLLTAAHCMDDFLANDGSEFAVPLVLSSYHGDLAEAEIVAVDKAADIAILRAPWERHPALALASNEEVTSASALDIVGFRPREDGANLAGHLSAEAFSKITVKPEQGKRAITLMASRFVGPGWSGSPILLAGSDKCAGVFCEHQFAKMGEQVLLHNVFGSSIHAVRKLAAAHGIEFGEREAAKIPLQEESAAQKFELLLSYFSHKMNGDEEGEEEAMWAYVKLSPEAPHRHYMEALSAADRSIAAGRREKHLKQEEAACREFLRRSPSKGFAQVQYGCFLLFRNRFAEAAAQLEEARKTWPENLFIAQHLLRAYSGAKDARALDLGAELCTRFPENHGCWFEQAGVLRTFEKHQDAVRAMRKALGCGGPFYYHGRLANTLSKAGELEEAEMVYQAMLKREPENASFWFWFAEFLTQYYPDRKDEARRALEKAGKFRKPASFAPGDYEALRKKLTRMSAPISLRSLPS